MQLPAQQSMQQQHENHKGQQTCGKLEGRRELGGGEERGRDSLSEGELPGGTLAFGVKEVQPTEQQ